MRTLFTSSMRTLYGLCLAFLLCGFPVSCGDASSELPEAPGMSVSCESLLFSESGGEQVVTFRTNRAWTAMLVDNLDGEQQPWCTLSAESGGAGKHRITVRTERLDGDYRQAVLLLNASAAGREIVVMQSGRPVVATADAREVDEASATLGGSWSYSGELSVAEFGIAIRKDSEEEYAYRTADEQGEDGSFVVRVTGLENTTSYFFAAYVLTADGMRCLGEEKSFVTDAPPVRMTIAELKAAGRLIAPGGQQTMTESRYVEGVVVASRVPDSETAPLAAAGEAYAMIVDGSEPHSGITLRFADGADNVYHAGDLLSVRIKDGVVRHAQSGAVDILPLPVGIRTLSSGNPVEPVTVDHTKLADYESMFVRIEHTQLTRLFTDISLFPTWGSAADWNMEVENSEVSYSLRVPAASELAAAVPASGSGAVEGIVAADDETGCFVRCDDPSCVAGLTGERFQSLLELKFLAPEFQGVLCAGEAASGFLAIPYRNGDNSVIEGVVSAEIAGDPEVVGDLAVASVSDVRIGTGSGHILLAVTGTPGGAGLLTFTVRGLDALGAQNSCTAEVIVPELPEVGNFEATWATKTAKGDTRISGTSTNAAVEVAEMTLTASAANIAGTKWADFAAVGWDANTAANKLTAPVQYFLTTLTVGSGTTLALSGIDIEQRINGGDVTLSVQYALNGGEFVEIESFLLTSTSEPFTVNLGKVPALKALVEGTRVSVRLVPMATSATIKWGIKSGSRLALYGNAE